MPNPLLVGNPPSPSLVVPNPLLVSNPLLVLKLLLELLPESNEAMPSELVPLLVLVSVPLLVLPLLVLRLLLKLLVPLLELELELPDSQQSHPMMASTDSRCASYCRS